MKLLWFSFLVTCAVIVGVQSMHDVPGYYWRDFTGEIPSDALVAGKDERDNPLYVGQTLYTGAGILVAGKISSTTKKMYFEYGQHEHTATDDIKILCTIHPEQLRWIGTQSNQKMSQVVTGDRQLIVGGHDRGNLIIVGRLSGSDEVQVGHVHIINEIFDMIRLTRRGRGWTESNYEVLVYQPPVNHIEKDRH